MPSNFGDELAFYRSIIWEYALVNEAAKIPLAFLTNLPPLRANKSLRNEISTLRTYVAHNLDMSKKRDQKTYAFVHRWFKEACGRGTPSSDVHYANCCYYLVGGIREVLNGAIEACATCSMIPRMAQGSSPTSRAASISSGKRIASNPIVDKCAARLGNPGLDLLAIRSRHLEGWRSALAQAAENERVLEQRIEADLLSAIGDTLPRTIRENLQRVAASTDGTVAALLLLREARRIGHNDTTANYRARQFIGSG